MALKRKVMAGITAVSLVALIVAGTFAWTSLNSQRVNEWRGSGNPGTGPGGTLHDDHADNEDNKDVYIENWGGEDLFARIRLTEYMEIGRGAGLKSVYTNPDTGEIIHNSSNLALPVSGGDIDHLNTWSTIANRFPEPDWFVYEPWYYVNNYWDWEMGGQKYYYPASESNRETKGYVDQNSPENLTADSVNNNNVHAKQTRSATIMTMAEWKEAGRPIGDYWVIDKAPNGCWAYWAAPLKPGDATGLLLNRVTMSEDAAKYFDYFGYGTEYYYGINVEAQMATKEGAAGNNGIKDNYERFGDDSQGGWSQDGHNLMDLITGSQTAPPDYQPPYVTVSGADVIDNIIYAKPRQAIDLAAASTPTYSALELNVNNAIHNPDAAETPYYTITARTNYSHNTLVFKTEAPVGYKLPINATIYGEEKIAQDGNVGWNWKYESDSSKTAVVIPNDCIGVVKSNSGKIYLHYNGGLFREFKDDGTLGPDTYDALP